VRIASCLVVCLSAFLHQPLAAQGANNGADTNRADRERVRALEEQRKHRHECRSTCNNTAKKMYAFCGGQPVQAHMSCTSTLESSRRHCYKQCDR
jgi:hypothetical protein